MGGMNSKNRWRRRYFVSLSLLGAVVLSLGLLAGGVSAQPDVEWDRTFGGPDDEVAYAIHPTDDGGYIVAGETQSFGAGGRDIWLLKIDAGGNEEWGQTFGGGQDDVAYDVKPTDDGGYIVAGETHSFRADSSVMSDFWLIKTDALGNELWSQRYGNTELPGILDLPTVDEARAVQPTSDGGYVLAGWTGQGPSNDFWLLKTTGSGERQWDSQFGGSLHDQAYAVQQTVDGGYILAGKTDSFGEGGSDFWLVKTDPSGNETWTRTFGGPLNDEARAVQQTADGGYILAGFTWSFGEGFADYWLVKTDSSGNEMWSRAFGGVARDVAHSVQQTADGGYVLAGWSESFPDGDHFWVLKTDASGNLLWSNTYGDSSGARAARQTADGGFVIAGWTGSLAGNRDFRVVKTEAEPVPEAPSEAVALLVNTGPSSITAAAVGLDVPLGDPPHKFLYSGGFLSEDNPLPPGAIACTVTLPGLSLGAHLVSDQVGSFGAPIVNAVAESFGSPEIVLDVTSLPFDLADESAEGGRVAGVYKFLSESPCASGAPAAPVGGPAAVSTPARDFFGTVVSIGESSVTVSTDNGTVTVKVSDETQIRLPKKSGADVTDFAVGDRLAISLGDADGDLVADKIFLVPGKTRYRHVPGVVLAVSDSEITIQPAGGASEPITLNLTPATVIRFHRGEKELVEGSFVVVGTVRDPVTGEMSLVAREINVTSGKPKGPEAPESEAGKEAAGDRHSADIRGIMEGVDEDGNLIVNGITVFLDPNTEIEAGLVTGQLVKIKAVLNADGTILALGVEAEDEGRQPPGKTTLEGAFGGVDDQGNWIVGGTPVAIGPGTDTDGLPDVGQRVEVEALYQEDGSLLAREIENKSAFGGEGEEAAEVKLTGTFQGTDAEGNWIINGKQVAVDALTRLEGSPAVGQRVTVEAVLGPGGSLLARKMEGQEGSLGKSKAEVKVRGTIDDILDDGSLIIDGIPVALNALTEISGNAEIGDFVEVKALLEEDGSLLAQEVDGKGKLEAEDIPESSKVQIEGTVESLDEEQNTLVVNGIKVALSALSETKGELTVGSPVKLEGALRPDGSVLARELKGAGRRATTSDTEVKVEGVVELVERDDAGNVLNVVVDGLKLGVEALTKIEAALEPGAEVSVDAIISDGGFLARKIEIELDRKSPEAAEVKVEGVIEALRLGDEGQVAAVTVNGVEVVIGGFAKLEGSLDVGTPVEIKGGVSEGVLVASKVEAKGLEPEKQEPAKFDHEGIVEAVRLDAGGNVVAVVVDGTTIAAEAITRIRGALEPGSAVEIEGVVTGGELVASEIRSGKAEPGPGRGSEASEEAREQGRAKAEEAREQAKDKAEEARERAKDKAEDDDDDDGKSGGGSSEDEDKSGSG